MNGTRKSSLLFTPWSSTEPSWFKERLRLKFWCISLLDELLNSIFKFDSPSGGSMMTCWSLSVMVRLRCFSLELWLLIFSPWPLFDLFIGPAASPDSRLTSPATSPLAASSVNTKKIPLLNFAVPFNVLDDMTATAKITYLAANTVYLQGATGSWKQSRS